MFFFYTINDTPRKWILPWVPLTILSSIWRSLLNSSVNNHIFTNILFLILPKIPWEKGCYSDLLPWDLRKIFSSIIKITIISFCDVQHFCKWSFDTTHDTLIKNMLSWDPQTIFCCNIRFITNSTCDLPQFCIYSLDAIHVTLRKDIVPGDPWTSFSSMFQIM